MWTTDEIDAETHGTLCEGCGKWGELPGTCAGCDLPELYAHPADQALYFHAPCLESQLAADAQEALEHAGQLRLKECA